MEPFETDPLVTTDLVVLAVGDRIHGEWLPEGQVRFCPPDRAGPLVQSLRPGLLMVDIDAWTPALSDALATVAPEDMAIALIADETQVDAVGQLLDQRIDAFLDPMADRLAGRLEVERLTRLRERSTVVRDLGLGNEWTDPLDLVRRDAERVARALAELAISRSGEGWNPGPVTAGRIRAHIKARRARDRFFGPDLFADPAWDMLLDLAAARLEQRRVSVSSLCIAAAVPTTTALRWIKTMMDRGLFDRRPDPDDARRAFIVLSDQTAMALDGCLDAVLNYPGQ